MKCGVINMCYIVEYSTNATRFIKKLDNYTKTVIKNWINKNLEGCTNPFTHGKPLVGDKSGLWRYRVGDYRLICEVQQEKVVILVVEIGHRRDIYKRF